MKAYNKLIAISLFLLFSCDLYKLENEVHESLVQEESKLVINSFISPQDTLIMALIGKSFPIYDKINPNLDVDLIHVEGAEVIISNGTVLKKLNEILFKETIDDIHREFYCYTLSSSEFPIVAGGSYSITATSPDGLNATAHCTIPLLKSNVLDYELNTSVNQWGHEEQELIISWQDIAQSENFYRIFATGEYSSLNNLGEIHLWKNEFYEFGHYSDYKHDGDVLKEKGKGYESESLNKLTIQLLTTDYHYYQYHTSIENYQSGNPFAEPSRIYSNVENGYGVFAGYQKSVFIVDLD